MVIDGAAAWDWCTVTSYEAEDAEEWARVARLFGELLPPTSRMQYIGDAWSCDEGTAFVGRARQGEKYHYMGVFTGAAAELARQWLQALPHRCTRLDIQRTLPYKFDESLALLRAVRADIEAAGRVHGWVESQEKGKTIATLYIGSWKSDKMIRVYMKAHDQHELLRCELVLRGKTANVGIRADCGAIFDGALEKVPTARLDMFKRGEGAGLNIGRKLTDTDKWLLETVLPIFEKRINSHDADARVAAAYGRALARLTEA